MKKIDHETPELILIVTDKKRTLAVEKVFQKGLDQLKKMHTALAIYIPRHSLKKMSTVIRLMDVKGLFIMGSYQKKGKMFADVIRSRPIVNTVVLRKNKYYGFNTIAASLALTAAASIRLWTGKKIDIRKLSRSIGR